MNASLSAVCSGTLLTLLAPVAAGQSLVAFESFDFGMAGTVVGGNGSGSGWAGTWDAGPNNDFAILASPSFDPIGHRAHLNGAAVPCFRTLDTSLHPDIADNGYYGADGASLWLRFDAQDVTQTASTPYFGGMSLFMDGVEELFIGVPWGSHEWGLDTHGSGLYTIAGTNDDQRATLVARIDFTLSGDRIRLWANPATPYPTSGAGIDVMVPHFTFNRLRMDNSGSGTGANARFDLDAIRLDKETGPLGMNYCVANPNSTGLAARMSATGSAIVASNDLVIHCDAIPMQAFGYFLTSQTQGFVANPGGSQGNLCLGGAIGRYVAPGQVQNAGTAGAIQLAVDLTAHPTPGGLIVVQPGQTWNFTAWYRDLVAGTPTSNFGDGLEIVMQ